MMNNFQQILGVSHVAVPMISSLAVSTILTWICVTLYYSAGDKDSDKAEIPLGSIAGIPENRQSDESSRTEIPRDLLEALNHVITNDGSLAEVSRLLGLMSDPKMFAEAWSMLADSELSAARAHQIRLDLLREWAQADPDGSFLALVNSDEYYKNKSGELGEEWRNGDLGAGWCEGAVRAFAEGKPFPSEFLALGGDSREDQSMIMRCIASAAQFGLDRDVVFTALAPVIDVLKYSAEEEWFRYKNCSNSQLAATLEDSDSKAAVIRALGNRVNLADFGTILQQLEGRLSSKERNVFLDLAIPRMFRQDVLVGLEELLKLPESDRERLSARYLVMPTSKETSIAMIEAIDKSVTHDNGISSLKGKVIQNMVANDPEFALAWLRNYGETEISAVVEKRGFLPWKVWESLSSWEGLSEQALNRALGIAKVNDVPVESLQALIETLPNGLKEKALSEMYSNIAESDPNEVKEWLDRQPAESDTIAASRAYMNELVASSFSDARSWALSRDLQEQKKLVPALVTAGLNYSENVSEVLEFTSEWITLQDNSKEAQQLASKTGELLLNSTGDVSVISGFVDEIDDGTAKAALVLSIATSIADTDPYIASEWVTTLKSPYYDDAAAALVKSIPDDPQRAFQWASSIGDQKLRSESTEAALKLWSKLDPDGMQSFLRDNAALDDNSEQNRSYLKGEQ